MTSLRRISARGGLALLTGACSMLALASPARSQAIGPATAAPVVHVGPNDGAIARTIDLTTGRSLIIDLPRDAKEVFVANPKVANAVVRSTRKLFLIGVDDGSTSVFVLDAEGRQIAALDVTVGRDLNVVQQTLRATLPHAQIDVRKAGSSILLNGVVNSASEAQQAFDIASSLVGGGGGGGGGGAAGGRPGGLLGALGGGGGGKVINNLTIRGKDQVMLRVTLAEVARNVLKQFGVSTTAGWSTAGSLVNSTPFPLTGQNFPFGNGLSGTFNHGGFSATATLSAFERAGVSRVLAEPTLTAISGESAKFFAGGEIPVPQSQSCAVLSGASAPSCTIGIEYKPYGVTLNFTPVVLSENRISIRVATDVSELDPQNAFNFLGSTSTRAQNIAVPALTVRRTETTVELPSGGVMMTAGLIQQRSQQAINGLPGLLNLPILGALFRSRDYQRQETELMILVTPFIAKPMEPAQVNRPDDGFVDAHDAQGVLLGRMNRLYGVVGAPPLAGGYKGRVGFITD